MMRHRHLAHHGILGQRWGKRNGPPYPLTPSRKSFSEKRAEHKAARTAKKDAKEYARAKMYYGEGAGTRRKLIKATVEQRSKDPHYKEQFDKYLSKQDMANHAKSAKVERKVNDAKATTAKTVRGVRHLTQHDGARVSLGASVVYGILHFTGADQRIFDFASSKLSDISDAVVTKVGEAFVNRNI